VIGRSRLEESAPEVAPALLGCLLVSFVDGLEVQVRITEVEAYTMDDPASHSFRGETPRNHSMFAAAGTLYVYRSYGIHWCANVVTGPIGTGEAVLVRAGAIVCGEDVVRRRRTRDDHLVDGPGKLAQALAISGDHDGLDLLTPGPIRLVAGPAPHAVEATPRVGLTRATDRCWRFVAAQ
jgi:DNA-3-methyladenine glycosylase